MKIASIILVFLTAFVALVAATPDKTPIQDLLKQEWKTLKFGFEMDGGDYNRWGPSILLQRIDDDRVVFSHIESHNSNNALPVALTVISPQEAAALLTELIPFIDLAKAETGAKAKAMTLQEPERTEVFKRAGGFGMSAAYLNLQIITADGHNIFFHDDFGDDSTETMNSFLGFLSKNIDAKKQPSPKPSAAPTHPPR